MRRLLSEQRDDRGSSDQQQMRGIECKGRTDGRLLLERALNDTLEPAAQRTHAKQAVPIRPSHAREHQGAIRAHWSMRSLLREGSKGRPVKRNPVQRRVMSCSSSFQLKTENLQKDPVSGSVSSLTAVKRTASSERWPWGSDGPPTPQRRRPCAPWTPACRPVPEEADAICSVERSRAGIKDSTHRIPFGDARIGLAARLERVVVDHAEQLLQCGGPASSSDESGID